jgi:hypothetical protein
MNEGGHEDENSYPVKETNDMRGLETIDRGAVHRVPDVTVDDAIVYLWATGREQYRPAIEELQLLASTDLFEWARDFGSRWDAAYGLQERTDGVGLGDGACRRTARTIRVSLNDGDFILTEGVIDEQARHVFTCGYCDALALALHRHTGWPLVSAGWFGDDGEFEPGGHYGVEAPDGCVIDIEGASDEWDWSSRWALDMAYDYVTIVDLPEDVEGRLIEARAATFVEPVLRLVADPDQPAACMGNPDRLRAIEEVRAKKSANGTSPIALVEADAAKRGTGGGDE